MNNFTNLFYLLTIVFLSSCASIEIVNVSQDEITNVSKDVESVSQDELFKKFLDKQWELDLADSPVFASMIGNKKYNKLISSNSIEQFNINKEKSNIALAKLQSFDIDMLSEDNKLNYRLAELGMQNDINRKKYPTYFMQLNQRGGVKVIKKLVIG